MPASSEVTEEPLTLMSLLLAVAAERERRWRSCEDAGPFACNEADCPAAELSCSDLATMVMGDADVCELQFSAVWDGAAPDGTAGHRIADLCPRSCWTCAWGADRHVQSGCESAAQPGSPVGAATAVEDAAPSSAAAVAVMQQWLRMAAPKTLEAGLCRHTDEQSYVGRSQFGGRGVFARRDLDAGEVVHIVRAGHLVGSGWASETVLDVDSIRCLLRVLRREAPPAAGRAEASDASHHRDWAYAGLLPAYDDLSALPEMWSDEELAWLQDETIVRLVKEARPGLEACHATLKAERAWEPEVTLDEVRWARALLQSRPLAIGSRSTSLAKAAVDPQQQRFFLVPFVDMLNTWLVPDERRVNVKLKSLRRSRLGDDDDGAGGGDDGDAMRPRAVLATTRPVRAGEELLLSYGLDLRQTTARYAMLNYGIVGNSGTEELPERCCGDASSSSNGDGDGDGGATALEQANVLPLWCVDTGLSFAGTTAVGQAARFPARMEQLSRALGSSPWNATTADDDIRELQRARRELEEVESARAREPSSEASPTTGRFAHDPALVRARRRVVAIEYRLGCKLGALGAIQRMEHTLEPPLKEEL